MALKLYKVAISGFFLTYAESSEKAAKVNLDDEEVAYSEMSKMPPERCPNGAQVDIFGDGEITQIFTGEEEE